MAVNGWARVGCLLVLVWALAFAVAAASADTRQLTVSYRGGSQLTAYGGHVVFSQFNPGENRWTLQDWHTGRQRRLPVASREVPFDADAGPDANGRPVVVYSRCGIEPPANYQGPSPEWSQSRACHLYRLALTPGARQHRIASLVKPGASDTTPTVWRGRIAFSRRWWHYRRGALRPGVAHVVLADRRGLRRLAGGTTDPHSHSDFASAMDLGPRRLAFLWGGSYPNGVTAALWTDRLEGGDRTLLDTSWANEGGCGFNSASSPNVTAGRVSELAVEEQCDDVDNSHGYVYRFLSSLPGSTAGLLYEPPGHPIALAVDRGTYYWVRIADSSQGCIADPGSCSLMASTEIPWEHHEFHKLSASDLQ